MFRNKCAQKAVQMACIPARDRSLSAMTHLSHPRLYTCHLVQSDWQSLDKLLLNTYCCAPDTVDEAKKSLTTACEDAEDVISESFAGPALDVGKKTVGGSLDTFPPEIFRSSFILLGTDLESCLCFILETLCSFEV